MLNSLLVQRRLFRGAPSLLYSYRYVRSEVRAAHWGILWARFNIQHLYFWFVLHAFIFSAVRGSASALIPAAAANLKQEVRHQNKIIWPTSKLTFMCILCLSLVGSVYLLRGVEASEAVGHPGSGHLEQPPHVQAWEQTGGMALLLLHVCPRRVSIVWPFWRDLNYNDESLNQRGGLANSLQS